SQQSGLNAVFGQSCCQAVTGGRDKQDCPKTAISPDCCDGRDNHDGRSNEKNGMDGKNPIAKERCVRERYGRIIYIRWEKHDRNWCDNSYSQDDVQVERQVTTLGTTGDPHCDVVELSYHQTVEPSRINPCRNALLRLRDSGSGDEK